jgi:hypothetical protein
MTTTVQGRWTLRWLGLLAGLVAGCVGPSAELVPNPAGGLGARVTGCPVDDCEPVLRRARLQLDANAPGHAAIVRERLGEPVCGVDGQALCTFGGPIGLDRRFVVVLDLADGDRAFQPVLCFTNDNGWDGAFPWDGAWC